MLALETAATVVAAGWAGAGFERVDRDAGAGEGKIRGEGASVGALRWECFADHQGLAQSILDLFEFTDIVEAAEHTGGAGIESTVFAGAVVVALAAVVRIGALFTFGAVPAVIGLGGADRHRVKQSQSWIWVVAAAVGAIFEDRLGGPFRGRADIRIDDGLGKGQIAGAANDLTEIERIVQGLFFDVGEDRHGPGRAGLFPAVGVDGVVVFWLLVQGRMKVMDRQANLPQVILALGGSSGFARGIDRRQQQCHQEADDGDHYE